jgi:hypothetical protein
MGSKYSLSHAIFCEAVYTVENQIQGPSSYISFWLRATYIQSALAVFTPSNIELFVICLRL